MKTETRDIKEIKELAWGIHTEIPKINSAVLLEVEALKADIKKLEDKIDIIEGKIDALPKRTSL